MIKSGLESVLRSYSIASEPSEEYLEFCVKLVPNGKGAEFFSKLNVGEEAFLRGPEGRFVCLNTHARSKFFVATGAGIAPIMSMIKDDLKNQKSEQVSLLFGVRHAEDLIWPGRLEELKKHYSNFSLQITLSQPNSSWSGFSGTVPSELFDVCSEAIKYYTLIDNDVQKRKWESIADGILKATVSGYAQEYGYPFSQFFTGSAAGDPGSVPLNGWIKLINNYSGSFTNEENMFFTGEAPNLR
jgi:hypothetical protein